jgi:hypothetical protein
VGPLDPRRTNKQGRGLAIAHDFDRDRGRGDLPRRKPGQRRRPGGEGGGDYGARLADAADVY